MQRPDDDRDALIRDRLQQELKEVAFTPRMRAEVRRAVSGERPGTVEPAVEPAPAVLRGAVALAAVALFAITGAFGLAFFTMNHEPQRQFVVSDLPGAAIIYNEERVQ